MKNKKDKDNLNSSTDLNGYINNLATAAMSEMLKKMDADLATLIVCAGLSMNASCLSSTMLTIADVQRRRDLITEINYSKDKKLTEQIMLEMEHYGYKM